jgi:hypothetical protein
MKALKYMNSVAIGIPMLLLISYPFFNQSSVIFAILSMIVTGIIQFVLALKLYVQSTDNLHLKIYFYAVLSFFVLWVINGLIDYNEIITYILFPTPIVLCIYLSVIIYSQPNE